MYVKNSAIAGVDNYAMKMDMSVSYEKDGMTISGIIKDITGNKSIVCGGGKLFAINDRNEIRGVIRVGFGGEEEIFGSVGAEYEWSKIIAVRAGYRMEKSSINSLSAGAGINFEVADYMMSIDYAISPKIFYENDADWNHVVSFGVRF